MTKLNDLSQFARFVFVFRRGRRAKMQASLPESPSQLSHHVGRMPLHPTDQDVLLTKMSRNAQLLMQLVCASKERRTLNESVSSDCANVTTRQRSLSESALGFSGLVVLRAQSPWCERFVLAHVCLVKYLHACCIHDTSCPLQQQQADSHLPLSPAVLAEIFVPPTSTLFLEEG